MQMNTAGQTSPNCLRPPTTEGKHTHSEANNNSHLAASPVVSFYRARPTQRPQLGMWSTCGPQYK